MNGFKLTDGQEQALGMVKRLLKMEHSRPYIGILRGYAGTGKTTLLRTLREAIGDFLICAPTGKAALRANEATGIRALTAHRLVYTPFEDPLSGQVRFKRKEVEELMKQCPPSKLLVVEEASMVNEELWDDIYWAATEMGCHLLCVGDPEQLPPVETDPKKINSPFGVLLPNFRFDLEANLTEITRQALDSPIIRASMMIRRGDCVDAMMLLPRVAGNEGAMLEEHMQVLAQDGVVICHRNDSRHELNRRIRERKKLPEKNIVDGEPLLVLRNNYDVHRFNGEVLKFDGWKRMPGKQWEIYDRFKNRATHASFGVGSVEGDEVALVPKAIFSRFDEVGVGAINMVAKTAVGKDKSYLHCNLGYTLTAHKSQGSEWKRVMVIVERSVRPESRDGRRWLYTAVTRAREQVSVVWLGGMNDKQII